MNLHSSPISKYHGIFLFDGQLYKVVEDIHSDEEVESITNHLWYIERKRQTYSESYFMPHGFNSVVYESTRPKPVSLMLDIRRPYDFRQWGRAYKIEKKRGCLVMTYHKRTDRREDAGPDKKELTGYLVVRGNLESIEMENEWVNHHYPFDASRGDGATERAVFNAVQLKTDRMVLSFSTDLSKALKESRSVLRQLKKLKKIQQQDCRRFVPDCLWSTAHQCAAYSLYQLAQQNRGVYAGIPWFFQFWARDELISTEALHLIREDRLAKRVIMRQIKGIRADGTILSHPTSSLVCADAPGWLFMRGYSLFLKGLLSMREAGHLKDGLHYLLYLLRKRHIRKKFLVCNANETWMDAGVGQDIREGACIELQAMLLYMYHVMHRLSGNKAYEQLELELREAVRNDFWNGECLADREGDFTVRPNIFIAFYFYPTLLSSSEWESCFDYVLPRLWCGWGGLASIDKSHHMFSDVYTGADNRSYHRGDSWYYLNSMAAMALAEVNAHKYHVYITKIVEASTQEILWQGCSGSHAEVSSASERSSHGCTAQAWSAALYLELLDFLENKSGYGNPDKNP